MTKPSIEFRRMVLGLPHSAADYSAVHTAVDLAELLQVDLLAAFIADATLLGLTGIPAVRELQPLKRGWHPIDLEQLTQDLERAAEDARRRFTETIRSRTIEARFDVLQGSDAIAALVQADDIVTIIEPKHPVERITQQFTTFVDAAFKADAAVLVLPSRLVRATGPIVAVVVAHDDPSISAALAIAAIVKERLIVVNVAGKPPPSPAAADTERLGVPIQHVAVSGVATDASKLASLLPPLRERLLVVSRGALSGDVARLLASLRGVPLLMIEPVGETRSKCKRNEARAPQ